MKPMKVEAGEHAPDVEELLKQANELMEKVRVKKITAAFITDSPLA